MYYTEEDFEIEYAGVLSMLAERPRESKAEQDQRWEWFKEYLGKEGYQDFVEAVLKAYRPKVYARLCRYTGMESGSVLDEISIATVKDNKRGERLDPVLFTETVRKAVQNYTGINASGNRYSFLSSIGLLYGQSAKEMAGENEYKKGTPLPAIARKDMPKVLELAKTIASYQKLVGDDRSLVDVVETMTGQKYTRKMVEAAVILSQGLNSFDSLDAPVKKEGTGEGDDLGSFIADEQNQFQEIESSEAFRSFLEYLTGNWNDMKNTMKKQSRDWIRVFLTKDILIELKLDAIPEYSEKERREWNPPKPEQACGQWCPKRRWCKKEKKEGCFTRYTEVPAGDFDIYQILKPYEEGVYGKLLYSPYLRRAMEPEPENLYQVYANLLRTDFSFADAVISEIMQKDKGTVSNERKRYNDVRRQLYWFYMEMS